PWDRLREKGAYFRERMAAGGFEIKAGFHPIVPIMIGDARAASQMAEELLDEGIYVIGFSYPVVPKGQARIRVQLSAGHRPEHLDRAVQAFVTVARRQGLIGGQQPAPIVAARRRPP